MSAELETLSVALRDLRRDALDSLASYRSDPWDENDAEHTPWIALYTVPSHLIALSEDPAFQQHEWVGTFTRCLEATDLVAVHHERFHVGVSLFREAAAFSVLLTGAIGPAASLQIRKCVEDLLSCEHRADWARSWAWSLTASCLSTAYWLDDADLARKVLYLTWLPKQTRVLDWGDTPTIWTAKTMQWVGFAFWRAWWVKRLGLRVSDFLDLERVRSAALHLFPRGIHAEMGIRLEDHFYFAHALRHGRPMQTNLHSIVHDLLTTNRKPWR